MRAIIQRVAILFASAVGIACGGARTGPVAPGFAKYAGVYRFAQQVSPDVYLDGHFVIEPDTIDVELKTAACRVETMGTRVQSITYNCGTDVVISFDRINPIARASYLAQVTTIETRTVCVRYVTNRSGQQVCAETRRESYPRRSVRRGRLRPERLDNAEWGSQ